jgi:hypothetical protein
MKLSEMDIRLAIFDVVKEVKRLSVEAIALHAKQQPQQRISQGKITLFRKGVKLQEADFRAIVADSMGIALGVKLNELDTRGINALDEVDALAIIAGVLGQVLNITEERAKLEAPRLLLKYK